MNTKDYKKTWHNLPLMRPAYIMIKDVSRNWSGHTYTKGTMVYGRDDQNTFHTINNMEGMSVSLPLNSVKFIGYVDINHSHGHIIDQFEVLQNV